MSDSKGKKPMTVSDYIKNQPHLQGKPLTIQNSYSALAEFRPLTYSKAATTGTNTQSTPAATQKSTYFVKPKKQHLMTTNFTQPATLKQLQTLTHKLFYENSLYPTDNLIKDRTFYEYILVDSKSVEITHYPTPTNPNLISYSTCKILRIASIQDLGFLTTHTTKNSTTPGYHIPGYHYKDYMDAFFRVFLFRSYDHSWFISLDPRCPKTIPGWFYEWWYWLGPVPEIYPEVITKTSLPFYTKHLPTSTTETFTQFSFHIDMGIPWICSWNFHIAAILPKMPYSLVREYRVKWWDKYNLDRCSLANIQNLFNTTKELNHIVKTLSKSIPLVTPSQLTTQPSPTITSPQKRPQSPATSTSSGHSKKLSKREKFCQIMVEFLDFATDEADDAIRDIPDQDLPSDTSVDPLFQDSQDPFSLE